MLKRVACMLLAAVLVLAVPLCSLADSFDPHRAMAFMVIKFDCGCSRYGTGSMIGRYGLVTAGHNLYCPTHGKGLKSCDFIFGAKSPNSGRYKYNGTFSYYVYDTFRNGYSSKDDIGYVIFDKPVGDSTGWFGYWAASDDDMNMEFTNVYLYSNKGKLQTLYTIQYVADSKQIYMDEYLDYSEGGPVFFTHEGLDGPCLVAVYTSHSSSGKGYGRRLTTQVINDMKSAGAFR